MNQTTIKAFTLAEVLITLVIIGVIAAITVPVVMNNAKWTQYKTGAKKAQSVLNNMMSLYYAKEGTLPQCGNFQNDKKEWIYLTEDCSKIYKFLQKNMNISKFCSSKAYANGCIPDYAGVDTLLAKQNPDMTDAEITSANASVANWTKQFIHERSAIVTTDGMIFIPCNYWFASSAIAVDVNGQKGPNKWGYDIIMLSGVIKNSNDVIKFLPNKSYGHHFVDKGGKTTQELLYGK